MKAYRYIDIVTAAFVAVILISNLASSAKIVSLGFSIGGMPYALDAGTFLFPLSYIFGDILTEVYGYARSRRVIWVGFIAMLTMTLCIAVIQVLPGEQQWQQYAGDSAYTAILGGISTGGILIASLTAYFVGEFSNSVILAKLKVGMNGRHLWVRTISSTLVGQLLDSCIFIFIACAFAVFPWSIAAPLIFGNYIFKVSVEALFTPLTYAAVGWLKKAESEDYYDRKTNFNPFVFNG